MDIFVFLFFLSVFQLEKKLSELWYRQYWTLQQVLSTGLSLTLETAIVNTAGELGSFQIWHKNFQKKA